jgi:hypothetical protein
VTNQCTGPGVVAQFTCETYAISITIHAIASPVDYPIVAYAARKSLCRISSPGSIRIPRVEIISNKIETTSVFSRPSFRVLIRSRKNVFFVNWSPFTSASDDLIRLFRNRSEAQDKNSNQFRGKYFRAFDYHKMCVTQRHRQRKSDTSLRRKRAGNDLFDVFTFLPFLHASIKAHLTT